MGADVTIAERPVKLRETERAGASVRIHKGDLPWLPEEYHETHLVRMRTGKIKLIFCL